MSDTPANEAEAPPIEELLAKIQCEELEKLLTVYPELSFEEVLS